MTTNSTEIQILTSESFTELRHLKDVPVSVKAEFNKVSKDPNFMADVGQAYSAGCEQKPNTSHLAGWYLAPETAHIACFSTREGALLFNTYAPSLK